MVAKLSHDISHIHGQASAKRALEVAAAGGHNVLLIGPSGAGKTMLGYGLEGLMPPLEEAEADDLAQIYQRLGEQKPKAWEARPFRRPDSRVRVGDMIGGGREPQPGEVSLAHHGVLFLDDVALFRREARESLRQPLEEGVVDIVRAAARRRFPARFVLVATMNACPCGHLGNPSVECVCTAKQVSRYRARTLSGALLDRIDLHVEVTAVRRAEMRSTGGERSQTVARRVARAREVQRKRLAEEPTIQVRVDSGSVTTMRTPVNAAMHPGQVRQFCPLDDPSRRLVDSAYEELGLTARALDRVKKVARTLADLDGQDVIGQEHVAEAIRLKTPVWRRET